ncbi:hypothetical protein [Paenisporosarcina sp. TG20]|uniref:hypothetical protein n=1 Tax=Paenisporosarcina sp. TG20 TaxID=1211706 RepID=UPI0002DBEA08|nr:hypothetical protein [Paenisporosarcina sp. TG20]
MKDEYLFSLVGKEVKVYKRNSHSSVGLLLAVNVDYLTLQIEDGEIIYYKTGYIKSIREYSQNRFNSIFKVHNTNNLSKASTFNELIVNFKNKEIRVFDNGSEVKEGYLMDIKDNFIVLYTERDGLLFLKEHYITSFSHDLANEVVNDGMEVNNSLYGNEVDMELYHQLSSETANNPLTCIEKHWVKINRKGLESLQGLVLENNEKYLILEVNNEIFKIPTYHVRSFSVSRNKPENQEIKTTVHKTLETDEGVIDQEESNEISKSSEQVIGNLSPEEKLSKLNKRRRRHKRLKKKQEQQAIQQNQNDPNVKNHKK